MMFHKFHPSILREYDIRGIVDKTLLVQDALVIGHLLGKKLKKNKIVNVGWDGRNSSVRMKESLIKGLIDSGAFVKEIGLGPTPMLYYSCFKNEAELGIMVTGSHNPKDHNGFKIVLNNKPFFGSDILALQKSANRYEISQSKGYKEHFRIKKDYLNFLIKTLDLQKDLNISWDSGNGSAGEIMFEIASYLRGSQSIMYSEINGEFPNHHPDPSDEKNLFDLKKSVLDNKSDFGIAFDGDGDRIGIVDDLGRTLSGDLILLIFAENIIHSKGKGSVIADVKCSQLVFDRINSIGGKAIISKTGHSNIKINMKKTNSIFAGEMSGHMFFADNYFGFDDALYAAVRFINIMSKSKKKLSEILDNFPKLFNTPEIRIFCEDDKKFEFIEKLKVIQLKQKRELTELDGIRVKVKGGWWLMRASNTQPCIVFRGEANSLRRLREIIEDLKKDISIIDNKITKQLLA